MNLFRVVPPLLIVIMLLLAAGCVQEQAAPVVNETTAATGQEAMVLVLSEVTGGMQDALSGLDRSTSDAAIALGMTGLSGPEADAVLGRVAAAHPAVLTVITLDPDGTVVSAVPDDAKVLSGENLGDQPAVRQILATQKPLMSGLIPLAQGGYATVIEYPVYSGNGNFTGVISTAFLPWKLVGPVAENAAGGTPYTFMVAQAGGRVLYDPDPEEIGKETFNETLYADFPGILEFARQYSGNLTGYATYSFYRTGFGKVVEKEAFWNTIGMHGTEWRVIVISVV
jgi:CHASE domain.